MYAVFRCYAVTSVLISVFFFFFNETATTVIYTLSLHDALPIYAGFSFASVSIEVSSRGDSSYLMNRRARILRSEEHTSELQSLRHLVCRLLLEKKNKKCNEKVVPQQPTGDHLIDSDLGEGRLRV